MKRYTSGNATYTKKHDAMKLYMVDCQNYGPFWGPYYNTGPNTGPKFRGPKKGP